MSDLPTSLAQENARMPLAATVLVIAFGVLLPAGTLIFELAEGICAEALFDPLQTPLHVALVAMVPAANLWLLFSLRHAEPPYPRGLTWANGLTIGVGIFYSLLFAPLTPIGIVAVLYFGIGLLPLAPLLSLASALCLRYYLRKKAKDRGLTVRVWPGILLALFLLLGAALPATITRIGIEMASSPAKDNRLQGIRVLRVVGNENLLRQHCQTPDRMPGDLFGALSIWSGHGIQNTPTQAESTYFLVTGRSCAAEPINETSSSRRSARRRFGNIDFNQGGAQVGGRLSGLSLKESRLDASYDADAAVSYLEWIMVFRNETAMQREARAQIALPPGAVVSRLTLWIDGEEREAAFAGRSQVRAAYQKIVRQQRDPVLVTTAGQDRVLMQLFPVPPNGEMKVRVGMTIPATLTRHQASTFRLPYFHERNFSVPADLKHAIRVESKAVLKTPHSTPPTTSTATGNAQILRLQWRDEELAADGARISAPRHDSGATWAWDGKEKDHVVRQIFREQAATPPKHLYVVADASASLRQAAPRLADSLKHLPADMQVTLLVADMLAPDRQAQTLKAPELLAQALRKIDYTGGNDNLPALLHAMQLAETQTDSAILWLHGRQAVDPESVESLLQIVERSGKTTPWFDVQVAPGENRIAAALDGRLPATTLSMDDLAALVDDWRWQRKRPLRVLERLPAPAGTNPSQHPGSGHLVRLWAKEEIERLMRQPDLRDAAIGLAHRYQLVTPVSGAVVLENRQQYEEAGLDPARSGSVPSIPEPETWALIGIALAMLRWRHRRHLGRGAQHAPA